MRLENRIEARRGCHVVTAIRPVAWRADDWKTAAAARAEVAAAVNRRAPALVASNRGHSLQNSSDGWCGCNDLRRCCR
jgi:hypothetical protein